MPGALLPDDPSTAAPADGTHPPSWRSSGCRRKSHWDLPLRIGGEIVHFLVSHPTPPVFDGAEDRNGKRNFDEIRFWADYITPGAADYIYDDEGSSRAEPRGRRAVRDRRRRELRPARRRQHRRRHPAADRARPRRRELHADKLRGGPEAAVLQGGANPTHESDPAFDTADFADNAPGNLRADYVLPHVDIDIADAGDLLARSRRPAVPSDRHTSRSSRARSPARVVDVEVSAIDGRSALARLAEGRDPGGSAVVLL